MFHPQWIDDVDQATARLDAFDDFPPARYGYRRRKRYDHTSLDLDEMTSEAGKLPVCRTPPKLTGVKRKRWLRDLALYLARDGGMSDRQISDAFGLARSAVAKALDRFEKELAQRAGTQA